MPTAKRAISSRVTVENPRPRKYASAAEKQAAFRARFPTICVRVEPKTADTIQKIGDASGRTQQETMLSLVKFALTNRDFVNLGLTEHKQLPRMEETRKANPMKRKPTPAQIAARERFAEMARSGVFKKKASKARKKKPRASNPIILVSDKAIATKRKTNPVKPKDMTVYQVQYRKPGMKLFEPWMTVMYPKMAEDIARRLADEPMARTWTIKVESIKVKG